MQSDSDDSVSDVSDDDAQLAASHRAGALGAAGTTSSGSASSSSEEMPVVTREQQREGVVRRVLDYFLVSSPRGPHGGWKAMRVEPAHRRAVATALCEEMVYTCSDHVPITMVYEQHDVRHWASARQWHLVRKVDDPHSSS